MYIVADCRLKALEVPRIGRKYKDQWIRSDEKQIAS